MISNEEFMQQLPGEETLPDVFTVHGKLQRSGKSFIITKEYTTREAAEAQVEICKTWEDVIPESIEIRTKSGKIVVKQLDV